MPFHLRYSSGERHLGIILISQATRLRRQAAVAERRQGKKKERTCDGLVFHETPSAKELPNEERRPPQAPRTTEIWS